MPTESDCCSPIAPVLHDAQGGILECPKGPPGSGALPEGCPGTCRAVEWDEKLLEAQRQILQNEKLASVGQLAAGIAHEINTPIQFIGDNLRALSDFYEDMKQLVERYRTLVEAAAGGGDASAEAEAARSAEEELDLAYLVEETPKAIAEGLEGVERVAHIVRAMKDFSHVDRGEVSQVDLNHALQSTLTVAKNEYKYVADVVTDFGTLPEVECYASELNQVFLNLIVNASHAIADTGRRGTITIRTAAEDEHVVISVADTGTGVPEDVRAKIFDPFFTTKEVGKGTGQGLTIAHQIVVGRHGGSLTFESEIGQGTRFIITLPLRLAAPTSEGES